MPTGTKIELDNKYIFVYTCLKSSQENGGKVSSLLQPHFIPSFRKAHILTS